MNVKVSSQLFLFAAVVTILFATASEDSAAPAATTTTLAMSSGGNTVASGGSIAKGSEVSLTATVTSGSTKVTVGQVNFCDGSVTYCTDIHLLGTAQLTSAGTATIKFHPGLGDHSYKAVFAGTPNGSIPYAGSTSNTVTFTVTGISPTTTTITSSGSAATTLTAEVTGTASVRWPSGTISFWIPATATSRWGQQPEQDPQLNQGQAKPFIWQEIGQRDSAGINSRAATPPPGPPR